MTEQKDKLFDRRRLLTRTGKAAFSIAAASAVSYLAYDNKPPAPRSAAQKLVALPDFSLQHRPGQTMSVVRGPDRAKTVNKAIELLGGIQRFVQPGETVVIKPNVAFASSPVLGATTNPQLVAEIVRLCLKTARAKRVYVIDNPINDPASCFMLSGISKAATAAGAKIVLPNNHLFRHTTLTGGRLIKNWPIFFAPLQKAHKLIGVAPVKDHHRSGASMTMKNWYGLLGGRRNIFHQDINTIIAELAMMVRPTLVILDGTQVMMTNGPTGGSLSDLRRADTLIASCDQVAADSFGSSLLNLNVSDLPYLAKAQKAGAGTTNYDSLEPKFAAVN